MAEFGAHSSRRPNRRSRATKPHSADTSSTTTSSDNEEASTISNSDVEEPSTTSNNDSPSSIDESSDESSDDEEINHQLRLLKTLITRPKILKGLGVSDNAASFIIGQISNAPIPDGDDEDDDKGYSVMEDSDRSEDDPDDPEDEDDLAFKTDEEDKGEDWFPEVKSALASSASTESTESPQSTESSLSSSPSSSSSSSSSPASSTPCWICRKKRTRGMVWISVCTWCKVSRNQLMPHVAVDDGPYDQINCKCNGCGIICTLEDACMSAGCCSGSCEGILKGSVARFSFFRQVKEKNVQFKDPNADPQMELVEFLAKYKPSKAKKQKEELLARRARSARIRRLMAASAINNKEVFPMVPATTATTTTPVTKKSATSNYLDKAVLQLMMPLTKKRKAETPVCELSAKQGAVCTENTRRTTCCGPLYH